MAADKKTAMLGAVGLPPQDVGESEQVQTVVSVSESTSVMPIPAPGPMAHIPPKGLASGSPSSGSKPPRSSGVQARHPRPRPSGFTVPSRQSAENRIRGRWIWR